MDVEHLKSWVGREERSEGIAAPEPLAGLAALLDHERSPWPAGEVPPLGHWLYFLPRVPQSQIGEDGHPRTGGFLPPVPLPRRMWAGGGMTFHAPIAIGEPIERVSTIVDVVPKSGASGDMLFVTVGHRISTAAGLAIEERQDIVYRAPAEPGAAPAAPSPAALARTPGEVTERYRPDPVRLFRYSALTFNSHRIHYDRDYARDVEGYPDLVVHGPYQATLLIDLYLRRHRGARVRAFEFRGRAPLFDGVDATLNLAGTVSTAEAWTAGASGAPAMIATIEGE